MNRIYYKYYNIIFLYIDLDMAYIFIYLVDVVMRCPRR